MTLGGRYRNEFARLADQSLAKNLLEPILGLKLKLNDHHRTGLVFTNENKLLQLSGLFTNPVITNFRTLRSNNIQFNTVRPSNTLAYYWNYEENVRNFISSNIRLYRSSESPFLGVRANITDSGVFEQSAIPLGETAVSGLVYSLSKYFPKFSSTLKVGYEWNNTETSYILNEAFSDIELKM